jgi:hypothetical protein
MKKRITVRGISENRTILKKKMVRNLEIAFTIVNSDLNRKNRTVYQDNYQIGRRKRI